MVILQKTVSILLIATFVFGNVLCLCVASVAVKSTDVGRHAHHEIQAETGGTQACPHDNCNGNCVSLTSIIADDSAITTIPRSYELDGPIAVPLVPADQTLIQGSPIFSFVLHAPPALRRATPVSRFDRLLA